MEPMVEAFDHRFQGEGYSEALKNLNDIDVSLMTWGHFQRLVEMRMALEAEEVGSRLTKAERGQNLGRLGVTYLFMAHPQKAESFLSMAESIANDCKDQDSAGLWLTYRAWNSTDSGDLQAAKKYLGKAKKKVKNNAHKAFREAFDGWVYRVGPAGDSSAMRRKRKFEGIASA